MYQRITDKTLSFYGEPLARDRHKIHGYPAMLHPLLIDYLIKNYANPNDIIFDPFCGSGVTLLQASLHNYQSIGFEINPLALLISKVKTQNYNLKNLLENYKNFKLDLLKTNEVDIPPITNINYWYKQDVINDLGKIRYLLKTKHYEYQDFFVTCFAFICRNQSLTRNGEFKRYRMKAEKIEKFETDVFNKLITHIETIIEIIRYTPNPIKQPALFLKNAEENFNSNIKYDFVITSPPYGDSRTTVAYGQYSSFGMDWVNDLNSFGNISYNIDNECVGKKGIIEEDIYQNSLLIETVKQIQKIDEKRADDVLYFFNGYYKTLKNTIQNLNMGGKIAFVVGNRTVKNHQIPMDQITANFLDMLGMSFNNIFVRDILNKVMPLKNSPTNITGKKNQTMINEYIVIFDKKS